MQLHRKHSESGHNIIGCTYDLPRHTRSYKINYEQKEKGERKDK